MIRLAGPAYCGIHHPINFKKSSAPQNLAIVKSGANLSLTWNVIPGAVKYRVYRGTWPGGRIQIAEVSTNSYLDTAVVAGVRYYYTVTALINSAESLHSLEMSAVA